MIRFFRSLLRRRGRRAPAECLAWGGCPGTLDGAPLPPPDLLLCLPGHEVVEIGTVALDFGSETVETAICAVRPIEAGAGR